MGVLDFSLCFPEDTFHCCSHPHSKSYAIVLRGGGGGRHKLSVPCLGTYLCPKRGSRQLLPRARGGLRAPAPHLIPALRSLFVLLLADITHSAAPVPAAPSRAIPRSPGSFTETGGSKTSCPNRCDVSGGGLRAGSPPPCPAAVAPGCRGTGYSRFLPESHASGGMSRLFPTGAKIPFASSDVACEKGGSGRGRGCHRPVGTGTGQRLRRLRKVQARERRGPQRVLLKRGSRGGKAKFSVSVSSAWRWEGWRTACW